MKFCTDGALLTGPLDAIGAKTVGDHWRRNRREATYRKVEE